MTEHLTGIESSFQNVQARSGGSWQRGLRERLTGRFQENQLAGKTKLTGLMENVKSLRLKEKTKQQEPTADGGGGQKLQLPELARAEARAQAT